MLIKAYLRCDNCGELYHELMCPRCRKASWDAFKKYYKNRYGIEPVGIIDHVP